jgi:hypothetical protein
MSGHRCNGSCVCISLWIEKAVEVCYVHDKRLDVPSSTACRDKRCVCKARIVARPGKGQETCILGGCTQLLYRHL